MVERICAQILHPLNIVMFLMMMSCSSSANASSSAEWYRLSPSTPDFELLDMQNDTHQLSSYAGKTVIVNFWAVWCAPCRKEIPAMNRALAILKDENVVMLAINVGDDYESIKAFSKAFPMDFTVLMDKNGAVSQDWRVSGFPTTFIISPQGQIVYRAVGGREWDEESMLDSVRSIAAITMNRNK